MVGAADALDEALDVLRRADLDHQVDVAPVDAEVERGGADDGAKLARDHGGLDAGALLARERAVVDADGQVVIVGEPERVEEDLGLRAGVVEDERGVVARHLAQDGGDGVAPAAAGPGGRILGVQYRDVGVGAGIGVDYGAGRGMGAQAVGHALRVLDGGREADAAEIRAQGLEARDEQHQLLAALVLGHGVDLVHDDAFEVGEDAGRVLVAQEEREGFGGGQEDVRRVGALALSGGLPGVAGAVLDPDGEGHLGHGGGQVALDVGGQGLERADVDRVHALVVPVHQLDQGGQEAGQRLAAAGGGDEQKPGVVFRVQHRLLVRVDGPAAGGEPVFEAGRERGHARLASAGGAGR